MEGSERGWLLGAGPILRRAGRRWMTGAARRVPPRPASVPRHSRLRRQGPVGQRAHRSAECQRSRKKRTKKNADDEIVWFEENEG